MNPAYDFRDHVALVTGAGSGMGRATAHAFAESGAAVVLADNNEHTVRAATAELASAGRQALGVVCDVSDEEQVAALVEGAVATIGRLDIAFNNAGIQAPPTDAADEPAEIFDRVNAINLRGVWACMKHELRPMRAQGSGAIVNCSSLGGLVGLPGRAAYHASKHGVLGLTKSSALEYAARGIRINAICPGPIETAMVTEMIAKGELDVFEAVANQPIGRLGRADEIAAAVLWQCSPGASFVVGVALPIDGGYTAR
jgi:NAD(P)-dependent dehydrogenase (short-subunit alcohol dehydrogenase family)